MDTRISIRLALPNDDALIGRLLVRAFVETYAKKMPEVVVDEERRKDLQDVRSKRETACVLVAESGEEIVGTVTLLAPKHPQSEAKYDNAVDLRYLAVDPSRQKEGIADSLVRKGIDTARKWRAARVCLHVRRGATGIGRFYQRHGFIRDPDSDLDLLPLIYLEGYYLKLK